MSRAQLFPVEDVHLSEPDTKVEALRQHDMKLMASICSGTARTASLRHADCLVGGDFRCGNGGLPVPALEFK